MVNHTRTRLEEQGTYIHIYIRTLYTLYTHNIHTYEHTHNIHTYEHTHKIHTCIHTYNATNIGQGTNLNRSEDGFVGEFKGRILVLRTLLSTLLAYIEEGGRDTNHHKRLWRLCLRHPL